MVLTGHHFSLIYRTQFDVDVFAYGILMFKHVSIILRRSIRDQLIDSCGLLCVRESVIIRYFFLRGCLEETDILVIKSSVILYIMLLLIVHNMLFLSSRSSFSLGNR